MLRYINVLGIVSMIKLCDVEKRLIKLASAVWRAIDNCPRTGHRMI